MPDSTNFQRLETKARRQHKPERHDARKFIEPVRSQVREAFTNTSDSEHVARHFESTIRSTMDVVVAGHDATIQEHGELLAEIRTRLGMGRSATATGRMSLVARRSA